MEGIVASAVLLVVFTVAMLAADHQRAKRWDATMGEVDAALRKMTDIAERRQQHKVVSRRLEKVE